jgi:deazaflavin-dependent oxidoreductase (nitroreductase family)
VPLLYFTEGERLVVVASHGGSELPPDWLLNLQRDPQAVIQVGAKQLQVKASLADQAEWNRLWPFLTTGYPGLDDYQKRTTRQIAVVFLQARRQKDEYEAVPISAEGVR